MSKPLPLMGHLVLGYPTLAETEQNIATYVSHGVKILELQIPFSDPSADGPTITHANQVAIRNGCTTDQALTLILKTARLYPKLTIIPMTYANKIYAYGVDNFVTALHQANVTHIIIPDLPIEAPLSKQIHQTGKLKLVPVLGANVGVSRLDSLLLYRPDYIYLMADFKITGQDFTLNPALTTLVGALKSRTTAKIGVGFGVSTAAHLQALKPIADFGIIGSALIKAAERNQLAEQLSALVNN